MKKLIATTAVAMALAAGVSGAAFAQSKLSEAERADFRAEVRAYLMENPEVLMEAIAVLEERRNAEAAANDIALLQTNADEIFNDPASWVGGNPDGDITVVEFMDYRCGYCKKAFEEVAELIESDGNIRFVVKEFPILGEQSELASRFAVAVLQVEGAEAYEKAHDALMVMRADVTAESLAALGAEVGLADTDAVMARMTSPEVTAVIEANRALAQRLDVNGTPTFVIDETLVRGYVPLDGMRQIVDGQRKG
ncbi:DsbA family protein [Pseudorhodobacter sp. E13]|uniref:DsbA family protein n=1 Tax=Pseudorhodobacter sp. E13 TaxID=2487931 RepID=UPI000F8C680D|nr:DsbA family protein [Pseudorhodobacter sp. E13]RUS59112.1 DsbA family protein [Pseudorhodobacter sp. E13]